MDLRLHRRADVEPHVRLGGAEEQDARDAVVGEPLRELLREEEVIPGGDDPIERRPSRDPVVGVDLILAPGVLAEHEVRLVDADDLADLAAQVHADLELAVTVAEEDELRRARAPSGLLLFLLADRGDPIGGHLEIVRALIPAREQAVRDVDAAGGPERDRAGAAEVDVVGMGEDRDRAARELEALGHQTWTGCMRSAYSSAIASPTRRH